MTKFVDFSLLFIYCAVLFWLSDQSALPAPKWFAYQDKLAHGAAYFLLGIFACRSFNHFIKDPIILAILSIAFCSLYGLSDEWHQSFVPARFMDAYDWFADILGAVIGVFVMSKFRNNKFIARICCANSTDKD